MPELRSTDELTPGLRVRVTKQVARTQKVFVTTVEGVIRKHEQKKTGSWYAHAKDDKLWLDRLEIVKDDGEVYTCNLDPHTHIEIIGADAKGAERGEGAGSDPSDTAGA